MAGEKSGGVLRAHTRRGRKILCPANRDPLATYATTCVTKRIERGHLKALKQKAKRPANCPNVVVPLVNPAAWRELDRFPKVRDCNSVTRYLTLITSQFTPTHLHGSFLGLAFSSPCLRVTSSHLYAHFSSIYSCELKKNRFYSQQLSADLLHW